MTAQELREQRARLIAEARVIVDGSEGREMTAEETANFDRLHDEAANLHSNLTTFEFPLGVQTPHAGTLDRSG